MPWMFAAPVECSTLPAGGARVHDLAVDWALTTIHVGFGRGFGGRHISIKRKIRTVNRGRETELSSASTDYGL